MSALLAFTLLFSPQAAPSTVPPPPLQTSVECARPVYAVDHLICSDEPLLNEENELARLYGLNAASGQAGPWIEDQRTWIARRARCAFREDQRACVLQANAERRHVLAPGAASPGSRSVRCPNATGQARLTLTIAKDVISAYDTEGRKVFVATGSTSEWTPFLRIVSARRLEFLRQDGATLRCRIV